MAELSPRYTSSCREARLLIESDPNLVNRIESLVGEIKGITIQGVADALQEEGIGFEYDAY